MCRHSTFDCYWKHELSSIHINFFNTCFIIRWSKPQNFTARNGPQFSTPSPPHPPPPFLFPALSVICLHERSLNGTQIQLKLPAAVTALNKLWSISHIMYILCSHKLNDVCHSHATRLVVSNKLTLAAIRFPKNRIIVSISYLLTAFYLITTKSRLVPIQSSPNNCVVRIICVLNLSLNKWQLPAD